MPRPSFFKEKKPEVLVFVRGLSAEYRQKGDPLSLNQITKKLRAKFRFLPAPPVAPKNNVKPKTDALKLVVYRLCNTNGIWFGDPDRTPSRMRTAPPVKKAKKA